MNNHSKSTPDPELSPSFAGGDDLARVLSETLKSLKFSESRSYDNDIASPQSIVSKIIYNMESVYEPQVGKKLCKKCYAFPCLTWCANGKRKFQTQSNETHGDTDEPTKVQQIKTTRFEDAQGDTVNLVDSYRIPIMYRNNQQPIETIIGKPFQLATFEWTPTDVIGKLMLKAYFPSALALIEELQSAMLYYSYFRPEVEMIIKVNGTPMHYGKLLASVGYSSDVFLDQNTEDALAASTNRQWIQISANSVRSGTIAVPWMSPVERFPLIDLYSINPVFWYSYASLDLRVAVPLLLNGDGVPAVQVTTYMVIKKPNFSGYNIPGEYHDKPIPVSTTGRLFVAQMDDKIEEVCEAIEKSKEGVLLSNITWDLSEWIDKFRWVPVIGTGASMVSSVLGGASRIIKALGFSIPPNVKVSVPMFSRYQRLYQAEDVANTIPLAPVPYPYVVKDPKFVGSKFEDFSLVEYLSHPTYWANYELDSTLKTGEQIAAIQIRPDFFYRLGYDTGDSDVTLLPTRLYNISRLFYRWRGGIKFHFSVTASRFHSMRIRFTWWPNPVTVANNRKTPIYNLTQNQLATLPSLIFDINGDSDCSLVVPYLSATEWKTLADNPTIGAVTDYGYSANGVLYVTVVNPLVNSASQSTASGVRMQIFVAGASDFQFAQPTLQSLENVGRAVPFIPPPKPLFTTEMNDDVNFSSEGLRHKDCHVFAGLTTGNTSENLHMSTAITSLKQLYNMGGFVYGQSYSNTSSGLNSTVLMGQISTFSSETGGERNYLCQLAPAFGFWRGGIRITAFNRYIGVVVDTAADVEWSNAPLFESITESSLLPAGYQEFYSLSTEGCHAFGSTNLTSKTVDIPWYSIYRFLPVNITQAGADFPVYRFLYMSSGTLNSAVSVYISGADDFMMFYDDYLPYCIRAKSPV